MAQRGNHDWYWNELHQVGPDYESDSDIAAFDMAMRRMHDVDGENRRILELLKAGPESSVLEIGTATGSFARLAARTAKRVKAVDISDSMLHYAAGCARSEGLGNIEFERAGFLSFNAKPGEFTSVVSRHAFHHLPDLWKAVALGNIHTALGHGGRFVLLDVVFDWRNEPFGDYFSRIAESAAEKGINFASYVSHEYGTFNWIIRGLIERSGFRIESETAEPGFRHMYSCIRD